MLFRSSCRYAEEEIRGGNGISKETMTVAPECILNFMLDIVYIINSDWKSKITIIHNVAIQCKHKSLKSII